MSDEDKQLEVHKQCMEWFKEFQTNTSKFSQWFDSIEQQDTLEKRRVRRKALPGLADSSPEKPPQKTEEL